MYTTIMSHDSLDHQAATAAPHWRATWGYALKGVVENVCDLPLTRENVMTSTQWIHTHMQVCVCVAIVVGWVVSWRWWWWWSDNIHNIYYTRIYTHYFTYTRNIVYIHTYIVNIYIPHDVYTNNGCGVICGCDIGWGWVITTYKYIVYKRSHVHDYNH